jgi:hypothetical protein
MLIPPHLLAVGAMLAGKAIQKAIKDYKENNRK